MQPDYALILSAGLGTRMGELGKTLPKVIWPIFSKSLLELQIDYCVDLGIKNIYINVHFLAEEIIKHVKTINRQGMKIIVLHEDPLLDSGGAIHNLASRAEINYGGTVLLVNGDQFLFFDNIFYSEALNLLLSTKARAVLFGITVDKSANYNQTVVRDGMLVDIQKNQKNEDYITYSGLGIVKLDGLHPAPGASKFFQTVVNYKNELTYMITPPMFEYWDFGTAELYCENIFKIATASNSQGQISNFLSKHKVNPSDNAKFVNLNLRSLDLGQEGIFQKNCIGLKGMWQNI
jgi:mannose-1-phosphate guanylyltransferase